MNKPVLLSFLFGLSASLWAPAQSETGPRVVARLQPGMTWQVEELPPTARIVGDESAAGSGRLVEKGSVGRDHRRKETLNARGEWIDQYITGEFLITRQSDDTFTLESTEEVEESRQVRLRPDRLREFAWLEKLPPSARMNIDGVECDIYAVRFDGSRADLSGTAQKDIRFVAAIGVDDRFPRRLETPASVLRFVPGPPIPPANLPAGAQAALAAYAESLRKKVQQHALPR